MEESTCESKTFKVKMFYLNIIIKFFAYCFARAIIIQTKLYLLTKMLVKSIIAIFIFTLTRHLHTTKQRINLYRPIIKILFNNLYFNTKL